MERAIALAVENVETGLGGPFGAVIVRDGEVIAEGTNRVTTDHDPTAHAEVLAIRAACEHLGTYHLPGCEIYTSCEPCPMCLGAIYWARLDRIWYAARRGHAAEAGFSDQEIYDEIPHSPEQRTIPALPLLPDRGDRPFEAWHRSESKTPY